MEPKEYRIKALQGSVLDLDEKGIVRVYINKFNVPDSYNEMSLNGSFKKTFSERLKKMWWLLNHDWDKSLGVTVKLEEDNIGAIATGKFNLDKQLSRDVYSDYLFFAENGHTLQHSVRVYPVKYTIEEDIMKVSEWKMSEWSTLTRPGAIEDTPAISIKAEIEQTQKQLNYQYSDERLKELENKITMLEKTLAEQAAQSTLLKQAESEAKIKQTIDFINKLNF